MIDENLWKTLLWSSSPLISQSSFKLCSSSLNGCNRVESLRLKDHQYDKRVFLMWSHLSLRIPNKGFNEVPERYTALVAMGGTGVFNIVEEVCRKDIGEVLQSGNFDLNFLGILPPPR